MAHQLNLSVLFDCHTFDVGPQGTTTFVSGLINSLPEAVANVSPDVKLHITCTAANKVNVKKYLEVEFDFVKMNGGFIRRNLLDIPIAALRVRPNVVVSQYVRPFFCPYPTFSVIHDVLFLDFPHLFSTGYRAKRNAFFRWSALNSSRVITVSDYSATQIKCHYGVDERFVSVIPNGISPLAAQNFSRHYSVDDRQIHLLSVSRLEKRKRHEWGFDAMRALKEAGIRSKYIIVGDGDCQYADVLRSEIIELQKEEGFDIGIFSNISDSSLFELYCTTDIFLFPSEAEGFGIPVIEAAAVGTPCVLSDGGALAELSAYVTGEVFSSTNKGDFLSSVVRIAKNLEEYRARALESRRSVIEKFSWKNAAEMFVREIIGYASYTK